MTESFPARGGNQQFVEDENLRLTGRTTRMLEEANRLAEAGNRVIVVAATHEALRQFPQLVRPHMEVQYLTIDQVKRNQLRGFPFETVVLYDHLIDPRDQIPWPPTGEHA